MIRKPLLAAFTLTLAGAGCIPTTANISKITSTTTLSESTWINVAPDVSRYECSAEVCGSRLILYRFAKDKFAWRFINNAVPMTVEAWAEFLPKAIFVANGVYFDEKFQPTGLLKTSNAIVNNRVYDLKRSSLLELSPSVAIIDTAAEKLTPYPDSGFDLMKMNEVAQSYPLLIGNGIPRNIIKDEHPSRRTVIGTDRNGNVYVGVIPDDLISFANLSKVLAETGVTWNNVLNLDGGASTGFAFHAGTYEETMNSIAQVPNVIVAERK
jgi:hypothetical protein